ncbi:hypothetical protein GYMLUDRAFT_676412 [Collybiopsis luxurians FD-317 M1]|uniref:Uncharacterized protein n=1 Tax=Collybiopsis luxurians FD-317 M1 TaxID=944289 RepID=A0A0D0BUV5_9AGAR|nr:hypothetical protein GYMLUDRAFT_676412 [Collybiopsis luxurians FD-317 M1]
MWRFRPAPRREFTSVSCSPCQVLPRFPLPCEAATYSILECCTTDCRSRPLSLVTFLITSSFLSTSDPTKLRGVGTIFSFLNLESSPPFLLWKLSRPGSILPYLQFRTNV